MAQAAVRQDRQTLDELRTFRKDCGSYVRLYDFMSQVVDYGTSDLEKLVEFLRQLTRLLAVDEPGADVDVSGLELRRVRQIDQGQADIGLSGAQPTPLLQGITGVGSGGSRQDPQQALLSEVVARINALFGSEFADPQIEGFVIAAVDTVIHLAVSRASVAVDGFEVWVRTRIVAALPGAGEDPE